MEHLKSAAVDIKQRQLQQKRAQEMKLQEEQARAR